MAISNRRKAAQVKFEQRIGVYLMAIDGTWRRNCIMEDISKTGAKLTIEESIVESIQGIFPIAIVHRLGVSTLRADLGERRPNWR